MPHAPVVIETTEVDQEYEDLFSIDGEWYQIRKTIPQSISLKALRVIEKKGEAAVVPWMFDEVCTEGAFDALAECESITESQMRAVVKIVEDAVMGSLEKTRGKSRNGTQRSAGS
jgi:hypothetical protein